MSPELIAELRAKRYNATVSRIQRLHSDLMILRVRPDFPRPPHLPGQYCSLGLGYWEPRVEGCQPESLEPDQLTKLVLRPYSLSHSVYSSPGVLRDPANDDFIEFYIVLVRENPDGRVPALTPRLFALREGDRLKMFEKITGNYTLDPVKPGDHVVFLSTGTGEAPHNYMLWELLRRKHEGRILAACCVRYARDLGYLATHHQLKAQFPNYNYLPLTTREGTGSKKYLQDLLTSGELESALGVPLDPANSHVYLCGNPKMIGVPERKVDSPEVHYPSPTGMIELLERRGFRMDFKATKFVGNVHVEEYW